MHEVVFPLEPLSPPGDTMKPRFLWVLYPNKIVPVICRRFRHRPPLLPRPRRVPFSAEFGSFGLGAFGAGLPVVAVGRHLCQVVGPFQVNRNIYSCHHSPFPAARVWGGCV